MRTSHFLTTLVITLLGTGYVNAACTIESAQKSMVEVSNMMQVYNRQKLDYLESQGSLPEAFDQKFTAFVNRSNALGVEFGSFMENNTNLRPNDAVDDSICQSYERLFADYAPDNYQKQEVKLQQTSDANPDCNTTALWEKYAVLIQDQAALTQQGKFSKDEEFELMRLSTDIGQAATTDINQACALLDEFATKIEAKQ